MKKTIKLLILVLALVAGVTFVLQVLHNPIAWVFVSLYWLILTVKNYLDWVNNKNA